MNSQLASPNVPAAASLRSSSASDHTMRIWSARPKNAPRTLRPCRLRYAASSTRMVATSSRWRSRSALSCGACSARRRPALRLTHRERQQREPDQQGEHDDRESPGESDRMQSLQDRLLEGHQRLQQRHHAGSPTSRKLMSKERAGGPPTVAGSRSDIRRPPPRGAMPRPPRQRPAEARSRCGEAPNLESDEHRAPSPDAAGVTPRIARTTCRSRSTTWPESIVSARRSGTRLTGPVEHRLTVDAVEVEDEALNAAGQGGRRDRILPDDPQRELRRPLERARDRRVAHAVQLAVAGSGRAAPDGRLELRQHGVDAIRPPAPLTDLPHQHPVGRDDDARDRVVELAGAVHARRGGRALRAQADRAADVEVAAQAAADVPHVAPERRRAVAAGAVDGADPEHRRQRREPRARVAAGSGRHVQAGRRRDPAVERIPAHPRLDHQRTAVERQLPGVAPERPAGAVLARPRAAAPAPRPATRPRRARRAASSLSASARAGHRGVLRHGRCRQRT